jgi:hypothetical protein
MGVSTLENQVETTACLQNDGQVVDFALICEARCSSGTTLNFVSMS